MEICFYTSKQEKSDANSSEKASNDKKDKKDNRTEDDISFLHPKASYAFEEMEIDIRAIDKDMKYNLFGSQMERLEKGEKFKIPSTESYLIIQSNHHGRTIGYVETVRILLTFTSKDSVEAIVDWLYSKLANQASSLIIEGNSISINKHEMLLYIKRKSFLQIEN